MVIGHAKVFVRQADVRLLIVEQPILIDPLLVGRASAFPPACII